MDVAAANASLDDDYGDNAGASAPATHYLALFRDSTWTTELTGTGGIARIPITNNSVNWPNAASAEKTLAVNVSSAASTGAWTYDASAWALMDAATGGNRGDGGDFDDPLVNDAAGTVLTIYAGALVISYDTD